MRLVLLAALSAGALSLSACATSRGAAAPTPDAPVHWHSPLHRDHPWVGRVWDVQAQQFIQFEALEARLRDARYVLLGETHDNVDHHLLQARLVGSLAQASSSKDKRAVAFEMLDTSQQEAIDASLQSAPKDPDALAEAVFWAKSGWPPFAMYRPIFREAMEASLPILAANVPRDRLRAAMKEGLPALDETLRERLEREPPMSDVLQAELADEMRAAHCGHLPESMMPAFVLAQRMRDAQMALRMEGAGEGGAVLIAGGGHVRTDRGVPAFLPPADRSAPKTLSVVMREVSEDMKGMTDPSAIGGAQPFDFIVFTPAAERPDPCESLRQHGRGAGGS